MNEATEMTTLVDKAASTSHLCLHMIWSVEELETLPLNMCRHWAELASGISNACGKELQWLAIVFHRSGERSSSVSVLWAFVTLLIIWVVCFSDIPFSYIRLKGFSYFPDHWKEKLVSLITERNKLVAESTLPCERVHPDSDGKTGWGIHQDVASLWCTQHRICGEVSQSVCLLINFVCHLSLPLFNCCFLGLCLLPCVFVFLCMRHVYVPLCPSTDNTNAKGKCLESLIGFKVAVRRRGSTMICTVTRL